MSTNKSNEQPFDPLGDVKVFFYKKYQEGKLPVILLVFSMLYSLAFFEYPNGYEAYIFFPLIGTGLLLLTNYWSNKESPFKMKFAFLSLLMAAGIDLMVSISFTFDSEGIRNLAIPTLIADLLAIFCFIGWRYDFRTNIKIENKKPKPKSGISKHIEETDNLQSQVVSEEDEEATKILQKLKPNKRRI